MTKISWLITIVFFILFAIAVFKYAEYTWGITNSDEFGTLLTGTFGVIGSLGAMFAMIMTLKEQQKINKQKDVIDAFKYEYDRYINLMDDHNIKKELSDLWSNEEDIDGDSIMKNLNQINYDLSNKTFDIIDKLKKTSKNENLVKLATCIEHLSEITNKAGNLNTEVGRRIILDWKEIPDILKKLAGFYLAWNTSEMTINIAKHNDLIKVFSREDDFLFRLYRYIPHFRIYEQESRKKAGEWKEHHIKIESKSTFEIQFYKIELYFKDEERPKHILFDVNIIIQPNTTKEFLIKEIFDKHINRLISQIQEKIEKSSSIGLFVDFHINYLGNKKYIYQGIIEFNNYPNAKTDERTGVFSK